MVCDSEKPRPGSFPSNCSVTPTSRSPLDNSAMEGTIPAVIPVSSGPFQVAPQSRLRKIRLRQGSGSRRSAKVIASMASTISSRVPSPQAVRREQLSIPRPASVSSLLHSHTTWRGPQDRPRSKLRRMTMRENGR